MQADRKLCGFGINQRLNGRAVSPRDGLMVICARNLARLSSNQRYPVFGNFESIVGDFIDGFPAARSKAFTCDVLFKLGIAGSSFDDC